MTNDQFDALVMRLEGDAKRDPARYRLKVFLLALLGYGYVFFVLVVLLVLILLIVGALLALRRGGSPAIRLVFPFVALAFLIVRALWVRLPPPEGLALTGARTPALFREIAEIRRALKGPRAHIVLLSDEFNAGIVQIPRLGLFGWQKNYLLVGLPMMQALSPEQFRAVLAHEFGHLSGAHGRVGAWIYRVRKTWYQLMENLQRERHWGTFIFSRFFRWYTPFFGAYSFVLARGQEFEADRCSAELVGARQAADALIATSIAGAFFAEGFWPSLYAAADHHANPPADPYGALQRAFRDGIDREHAKRWVEQAMQAKTGSIDTHPALSDRLAALGQPPHDPAPVGETAAQALLGPALEELRQQLDRAWLARIAEPWAKRYAEAQAGQRRLSELEEKVGREALTVDERWQLASLNEEFRGPDVALPLYQSIVSDHADHAGAQFAVGRSLLSRQQAEGIEAIEAAMRLDADAILPGCQMIYNFLIGQQREQEAKRYYERATQRSQLLEAAQAERARVDFRDNYLSHGLSDAQVAQLKEQLARYPEIAEAYIVRKQLKHFPEHPLYALGVVARRKSWYRARTPRDDSTLAQQLAQQLRFSGKTFVVVLNAQNAQMKKIMQRVPGSRI